MLLPIGELTKGFQESGLKRGRGIGQALPARIANFDMNTAPIGLAALPGYQAAFISFLE